MPVWRWRCSDFVFAECKQTVHDRLRMPRKGQSRIAANFDYLGGNIPYGVGYCRSGGRPQQVDRQKFRNNYARMDIRDLIATARRAAEHNWFLRPVLDVRAGVHSQGFRMIDSASGSDVDLRGYDLQGLVEDLIQEDLVASNMVCLWRKGEDSPPVTVLDSERVRYRQVGGLEEIRISFSADRLMKANRALEDQYIKTLGRKMYDCMCSGNEMVIIKDHDDDWNFAVLPGGKRRGCLTVPETASVLDDLDMLELAKVGDWNLLWKRKDVMRFWKKGYKVTSGPGAGTESVNITKSQVTEIGEGAKQINGPVDIPMNHDVSAEYLTISPDELEGKHLQGSIDRLMLFGGIEAVVMLGSFSQQNGAAPSLMRNARARASRSRDRVERMLRQILSSEEFASFPMLDQIKFRWSQAPLRSVDEIAKMVQTTGGGIASNQTRREWFDLDNEVEGERMLQMRGDWEKYVPVFEPSQSLVQMAFPGIYGKANTSTSSSSSSTSGDPGRPGGSDPA